MTEADWMGYTDTAMLWESDYLWKPMRGQKPRVGDRHYRLFAVACSRRIWHLYPDDICRRAVEVSERYADGLATNQELAAVGQELEASLEPVNLSEGQRWARGSAASHLWDASYRLAGTVSSHCVSALGQFPNGLEEQAQCDIIRDLFPNPFHPVTFNPAWRTSTVIALAEGIYDGRVFDRMPILADALQDAGCDNDNILNHCRADTPHARGCWVVDAVLEKA